MKLDILAFGAHPDDVELSCSGTLLKHISQGKKVGIIDLTKGELGTRGNPATRKLEAAKAAKILGVSVRENLNFADSFFLNDKEHQIEVVKAIRKYQPEIILANAPHDRHPDHGRASKLVTDACFLSGLKKISQVKGRDSWRPKAIYYYIQDVFLKPDFVVDISEYMNKKMESIAAFSSQFHDPASKEPDTPISSPFFLEFVKGRCSVFGRMIGTRYAEGFVVGRPPGIKSFFDLE